MKAERGSAKDIANRLKAKGLQKLKWYCQVCQKQCRDENGFKCHVLAESHIKKVLQASKTGRVSGEQSIHTFSRQFKSEFLSQLRSRHGEKKIGANRFYNEFIQNKDHLHMNATKYTSLSQFVHKLANEGVIALDESEGLVISYIDQNPEAQRRKQALLENKRVEEANLRALQKQIEGNLTQRPEPEPQPTDENNKDAKPISISISATPNKQTTSSKTRLRL